MIVLNEIVNDFFTHIAFKLENSDKVFVYQNGKTKITNIENYKKNKTSI